ncbi:helicase C-terminal domain-containing protein [Candidatus Margulisiibacteriota bacterium]
MKAKKSKQFVIVDIETTGLAPAENEVIEIGAVCLAYDGKSFKEKGKYHSLIKPYKNIPPNIQNLTNITPKTVEKAPRFEEVYLEFLEFLDEAVFVAHNVQFDLQMLNVNLRRVGGPIIQNALLDSQQLIAITFPGLSSHKLGDIARFFNIDRGNGHRALDDALVTAEIFKRFAQEVFQLKPAVLLEMNKLLRNHSWSLKDLFLQAQQKACAGMKPDTIAGLQGWAALTKDALRFEKLKRPQAKGPEWNILPQAELEKIFAEGGQLAKQFKKYEFRQPQKEMLSKIVEAFNQNEHLLIEAGTGTGKSLAYLLPAIHWSIQNGTPVVISSRTKNLQAQLMDKDILLLKKVIGEEFNALLLKGRENYICLRRAELLFKRLLLEGSLEQIISALPLLTWISQTQTGDLSELHLSIYRSFLRYIKSEAVSCLGEKCALHKKCFLQNIRKQAKRADVLVVNHSLLFTDLAGDGYLLPEYKHLILDEGHAIEDAATESFSMSIAAGRIIEELKRFQLVTDEKVQELAVSLRGKTFELFELIHKFVAANKKISYGEEIKVIINKEVTGQKEWAGIIKSFRSWQKACKKLVNISSWETEDEAKQYEVEAAKEKIKEYLERLTFILDSEEKNYVRWLIVNKAMVPYNCFAKAAPIDVGPLIQEYLFLKKDSVVLTSATFTVAGQFDQILDRLGFEDKTAVQTCALGSSFDYKEQLLFCVAEDFPQADDEKYVKKVKELFMPLFEITQGRALVLFTSYKMLQKVYNKVRIDLEKKGLNILCQGKHGSRRAILNRFKENPKSILFGTDSFWEGVDVPGKALSCVVMMKLPFAVPSEPITAARLELYDKKNNNGFFAYSVPQAIMKFRQGLGRLIRTKEDKGVVILLDNRVLKKNYGKIFLRSIPGNDPEVLSPEKILKQTKKWLA